MRWCSRTVSREADPFAWASEQSCLGYALTNSGACLSARRKRVQGSVARVAWTRCSAYQHMLNENLTLKNDRVSQL